PRHTKMFLCKLFGISSCRIGPQNFYCITMRRVYPQFTPVFGNLLNWCCLDAAFEGPTIGELLPFNQVEFNCDHSVISNELHCIFATPVWPEFSGITKPCQAARVVTKPYERRKICMHDNAISRWSGTRWTVPSIGV